MKIDVDEQGNIVLKEIYNSAILETAEGNKFAICMRDDTVEMTVVGSDRWYKANMQDGSIEEE